MNPLRRGTSPLLLLLQMEARRRLLELEVRLEPVKRRRGLSGQSHLELRVDAEVAQLEVLLVHLEVGIVLEAALHDVGCAVL